MNDRTNLPVAREHVDVLIPFEQMERMAAAVAKSGLFGMKTPDQALALMLIAQAEGVHPATITQDYDIIQGRASRKTNSVLARFQAAGGSVEWHELTDKIADATFTPPTRAGKPLRLQWTIEMAKTAKLVGKDNWTGYARAMLRARCIAEGVRAVYPAAIGGMLVSEEAQDLPPEKDVTAQGSHTIEKTESGLQPYSAESFQKNLPKWQGLIEAGKKTSEEIIATIESKATLTPAQKAAIRNSAWATSEALEALWKQAAEASVSRAEVMKHFNLADDAPLTAAQVEQAFAFIADPVGGGK